MQFFTLEMKIRDAKLRENYENIKGEHPENGTGISPDEVVFNKKDLKDGKWLFTDTDERTVKRLKEQLEVFSDLKQNYFVFDYAEWKRRYYEK